MLDDTEEQILANVRAAHTGDLLDRPTVYRNGMEPEAVCLIEEELRRRGVTEEQQAEHAAQYLNVIYGEDGLPLYCDYCEHLVPAVWRGWRWYRYLGLLPLFPIRLAVPSARGPCGLRSLTPVLGLS